MWAIISNVENDDDGFPLYWSNTVGWSIFSEATIFTDNEMRTFNLPYTGMWTRVWSEIDQDGNHFYWPDD